MNLSGSANIALSFWTAVIVFVSLDVEPILESSPLISCGYSLLKRWGCRSIQHDKEGMTLTRRYQAN
jgi:hypothetical protein